MDIHPPDHPIMSMREFFIHIGTVTIGILIALSLEGLIEWNHHRHLVSEARENIRAEIEDNQREMVGHLAETAKNEANHRAMLQWIADIEKSHKSGIKSLTLGASRADLSRTSWTTAQTVGALGLMDYAEVKRDAAVYELQEEFVRLQTRAEDEVINAMVFFSNRSGEPSNASSIELQSEKTKVETSLNALQIQKQFGAQLQKRYTTWLKAQQTSH